MSLGGSDEGELDSTDSSPVEEDGTDVQVSDLGTRQRKNKANLSKSSKQKDVDKGKGKGKLRDAILQGRQRTKAVVRRSRG